MTTASWHADPLRRHQMRWWDGEGSDHPVRVVRSAATEPSSAQTTPVPPTTSVQTTAAATTTVPITTEPATTVAPSTTDVQTTTSTTSATTTTVEATTTTPPAAPPTTPPPLVVASADNLVAALPSAAELPNGWTPSDELPDTAPLPSSGLGAGYCGGDSGMQRALSAGVVSVAYSPTYWTWPEAGYFTIDMYAFARTEDASAFMALTVAQANSCLGGFQYQLPEGDGPNEYNGFSEDYGQNAVWNMTDTMYYSPADVAGADEAFQMAGFSQAATRYDGTNYAATSADVTQYERHDRIVIVFNLSGECCLAGFNDIDPSLDYQPTTPELLAAVDVVRPGIVQRLQAAGVVRETVVPAEFNGWR